MIVFNWVKCKIRNNEERLWYMILCDRLIVFIYMYFCVKWDVRVLCDCDLLFKNSNIGMDMVK